jgi:hypothetical protein
MATVLNYYITKEQGSAVLFSWTKGLNAMGIHKEIFPVYGGKCLSRKAVHSWVEKFSHRRSKVADDALPGSRVEIATQATVLRQQSKNFHAAGFDSVVKR